MNAPARYPLPTRAQIEAISTRADLEAIRDEIDRRIAKIETDLEFSDRDEEWAFRARNALSLHRYTLTLCNRRLKAIGGGVFIGAMKAKAVARERTDCHDLTWDLLDGHTVDLTTLTTAEGAQAAYDDLTRYIDAAEADRADEVARFVPMVRDEGWMAEVNAAIKAAKATRYQIGLIIANYRQQAKQERRLAIIAAANERQVIEARQFVDMAREMLSRETYLSIWDRVNTLGATQRLADTREARDGEAAKALSGRLVPTDNEDTK